MADREDISTWENAIYTMIIFAYVYQLIDQLTDGQLSTNTSMWIYKIKGKLKRFWNNQEDYEKSVGKMLWEAESILEKKDDA